MEGFQSLDLMQLLLTMDFWVLGFINYDLLGCTEFEFLMAWYSVSDFRNDSSVISFPPGFGFTVDELIFIHWHLHMHFSNVDF